MRNLGSQQAHGLEIRFGIERLGQERKTLATIKPYGKVTYELMRGDRVISRETAPMQSFVGNFLRLLWGRMTGTACTGGLNCGNSAIDESSGILTNLKVCTTASNLNKNGIVIGSGTGAVASGDYALTFDDAFTEGATIIDTETTVGASTVYFKIRKDFTNNTGASKTPKEAGIVVQNVATEIDSNTNTLIVRELINSGTGYAVANGQKIRVTFEIGASWDTSGVVTKNFIEALEMAFRNNQGEIWKTENASAITARATSFMVRKGDDIFVIGGYDTAARDDVWKSSNSGLTWTQMRTSGSANGFIPRERHCAWCYNNKLWVGFGRDASSNKLNSVYYSNDDGATWTQATASAAASARESSASTVFLNKMFIFGGITAAGHENSVYSSTDGATWTQVRADGAGSGFDNKAKMKAGVLASSVFLFFGYTGSARTDAVYSSTDGATWTQVRASGAASGPGIREDAHVFIANGTIVAVAGSDGTTSKKDVWISTTGNTWTSISTDFLKTARSGACFEIVKNKLVIFGGYSSTISGRLQDSLSSLISPFLYAGSATMPTAGRIDEASGGLYGLLVGTDATNFATTQTDLIAKCANGTGSGQISYGSMLDAGMLVEPTESGNYTKLRIQRTITNSSGASIDLNEVGLKCYGLDADPLLLCRQKLASTETITNGESLVVWGELATTV